MERDLYVLQNLELTEPIQMIRAPFWRLLVAVATSIDPLHRSSPNAAVGSPGKEIRSGEGKRIDNSVWQAGRCPACPVVGGKKHTAISAGKEICAGDGKSIDTSIHQAGARRCPARPVVCRQKHSAG